jgi:hypothetical protein
MLMFDYLEEIILLPSQGRKKFGKMPLKNHRSLNQGDGVKLSYIMLKNIFHWISKKVSVVNI